MEGDIEVDENFPLFCRKNSGGAAKITPTTKPSSPVSAAAIETPKSVEKELNPIPTPAHVTFSHLGLAEWAVNTCKELRMKRPTPVQQHCVPRILSGQDVMGLSQTGSGKTAAFALPILHRLAEDPYGVFALVVTPTRELAYQLAEQFRSFGSGLGLRVAVVVGGMDMINQAQALMRRPHVVIATPGRIKVLIHGLYCGRGERRGDRRSSSIDISQNGRDADFFYNLYILNLYLLPEQGEAAWLLALSPRYKV